MASYSTRRLRRSTRQPLVGEAHVPSQTQGQRAAAEMPEGEADVVTDDGGGEAYEADRHHVEPARARVDRGDDEHALARHGNPEVLDHDQEQDGPVAKVIERSGQRVQDAGQWRGTAAADPHQVTLSSIATRWRVPRQRRGTVRWPGAVARCGTGRR